MEETARVSSGRDTAPGALAHITRLLERRPRKCAGAESQRFTGLGSATDELFDGPWPITSDTMDVAATADMLAAQLQAMRSWQSETTEQLGLLMGRGGGQQVEGQSPRLSIEDSAGTRDLIEGMSQNAFEIALLEKQQYRWQAAADAVREALRLRAEIALEKTGEPLAPEPRQHLLLMRATFMMEGNTPRLRQELDDARQRMPDSPDLAYWSAHYHIMVGQYAEAEAAIQAVPNEGRIAQIIRPILTVATRTVPQIVHPSNFYTHRHDLVSETTLNTMLTDFDAIQDATVKDGHIQIDSSFSNAGVIAAAANAAATAALQRHARKDRDVDDSEMFGPDAGLRVSLKFDRERVHDYENLPASEGGHRAAAGARQANASAKRERERRWDEATLVAWKNAATMGALISHSVRTWQMGNGKILLGFDVGAQRAYKECQTTVGAYMVKRYPQHFPPPPLSDPVSALTSFVRLCFPTIPPQPNPPPNAAVIASHFSARNNAIDLVALYGVDWEQPTAATGGGTHGFYENAVDFVLLWGDGTGPDIAAKVDAPLLAIAMIFAQMGMAECYRMRRDFNAADDVYKGLLKWFDAPAPGQPNEYLAILCDFIEVPFIKVMKGLGSLARADNLYKSGTLTEARNGYWRVFVDLSERDPITLKSKPSEYVVMLGAGTDALQQDTQVLLARQFHPLAIKEAPTDPSFPRLLSDDERQGYQVLGKAVPAKHYKGQDKGKDAIVGRGGGLPGMDWSVGRDAALLEFKAPGQANPLVWALVSEAQSRLIQIEAGLNYLGYHPDYVPPARFQFLLDRARYFAEHAKNAERDYLNFRRSAEDEDLKEMTAAQGVVLEKKNTRVEDARVVQAGLDAEAANQGKGLSDLVARNADTRRAHYARFNQRTSDLADQVMVGAWVSGSAEAVGSAFSGASTGAAIGGAIGALGGPIGAGVGMLIGAGIGLFTGAASAGGRMHSEGAQLAIAAEQRELELKNLDLVFAESQQSAVVAAAQLGVARQGIVVATLQRASALARHEFAVQNLIFLRDRALNAELWYRLAELIREVGLTYLRRAIELAFLAEQAYEFEADKQVNVIRFDYDASETARMLAGDFLLNDLNALENDLVVSQRLREQHVRYVVSLAREFPSALQQLRETGSAIFTLPLRQLEQRFPGLYRLRIGSVDVLPIALMDPTRFSLELTHTGMSRVRVKGPVTSTVGSRVDGSLSALDGVWPVKLRLSGARTVVFSGLARADEQAAFPVTMPSQRNAFEGEGAASSWYLDMSMRENQVDPRTVADVLVTFALSGYYDAALRNSLETAAAQRPSVLTQYLSGRQVFADAFYEFSRTGTMEWQVTGDMLSLTPPIGTARNVGIILPPTQRPPQFGRLMCTYRIQFTITAAGDLWILSEIPRVIFSRDGLKLSAQAVVWQSTVASWDFGDGKGFQEGEKQTYTYARPGKYEVVLRVVNKASGLAEYKAAVVVSTKDAIALPLAAYPVLAQTNRADGVATLQLSMKNPTGESVDVVWKLMGKRAIRQAQTTLELPAGTYVLGFVATRELRAHIYSGQRYSAREPLVIDGLRIASNREFNENGDETNVPGRNAMATRFFGAGPISPVDRWTLELPILQNPFLRSVTADDEEFVDLEELNDAVLTLEYDVPGLQP